jgi:hypothetical protein
MLLPSILRTIVPVAAGTVLTVLTGVGLTVDAGWVSGAVTAAMTAAYYVLFRLVERATEKAGGPEWIRLAAGALLGYAKPPNYRKTDDVADLVRQSQDGREGVS